MVCEGAQELFQVAERFKSPVALNKAFCLLILSSTSAAERGSQGQNILEAAATPDATTSMWEPPCLDPPEKDTMLKVNIVLEVGVYLKHFSVDFPLP
jgi:hypothetical protein